jgi:hypothetical protein
VQAPDQLKGLDLGRIDIQNDQVGKIDLTASQCLRRIGLQEHVQFLLLQTKNPQWPGCLLVTDDQYFWNTTKLLRHSSSFTLFTSFHQSMIAAVSFDDYSIFDLPASAFRFRYHDALEPRPLIDFHSQ